MVVNVPTARAPTSLEGLKDLLISDNKVKVAGRVIKRLLPPKPQLIYQYRF